MIDKTQNVAVVLEGQSEEGLLELNDLQLAVVGGGSGETILH